MDLHPVFVHFPIALLTIYAIMELVRFRAVTRQSWWKYAKAVFVIFGVLGAFAALATGNDEFSRTATPQMRAIVDVHETVAGVTTAVFCVIALGYLLVFIEELLPRMKNKFVGTLRAALQSSWFLIPAALAGLVLITMTGALGGTLAYGCGVDPLTQVVCSFFP